jgi:glycosyltransferase involved in cell wall biosynthesis
MTMRIAHVTATFPPYMGGTGNVAYYNAIELAHRGHEVHIFTAALAGAPAEATTDGARVHRLRPWLRYGNAALLPQLVGRLRGFDVIHLHLPFYGGSEALLALLVLREIPLVTTHHQDVVLPGLAGRLTGWHDRLFSRRLMEQAQFACFTSLDYAQHSKFTRMAARLNVTELPNGVDVHRFTPGPPDERLRQELGVANRRVILFVGALDRPHYFKGVDRLLAAAHHLGCDDVLFVIVGSGDLRNDYQRQAAELDVADRVAFPGFVPDDLLPDYYRLADVAVLPSVTAGEAFGLVLLESLACATPVIASNLPGVRTVVADGVDGYLAEPGDAVDLAAQLERILNLPDAERRAMGTTGRRKMETRYSWERVGDILEGLYAAAAGRKGGHAVPLPRAEVRR